MQNGQTIASYPRRQRGNRRYVCLQIEIERGGDLQIIGAPRRADSLDYWQAEAEALDKDAQQELAETGPDPRRAEGAA